MLILFSLLSMLFTSCDAQTIALPKHLYKKGDNSNGAAPLIIMLHGYGSNADDLFSLANSFPANCHVVAFNGIHALASDSYAWFEFEVGADGTRKIDQQQELASRVAIESWIPQLINETGADPQKVYLFGFSQGAIMSATLLTEKPELIKGIMALSGRILPVCKDLRKDSKEYLYKKALVAHGYNDQVLPYSNGENLKNELTDTGVVVAFKTYYGMGHTISAEEMKDVVSWFEYVNSLD